MVHSSKQAQVYGRKKRVKGSAAYLAAAKKSLGGVKWDKYVVRSR